MRISAANARQLAGPVDRLQRPKTTPEAIDAIDTEKQFRDLLENRLATATIDMPDPVAPTQREDAVRISVGVMRQEIGLIAQQLSAMPNQTREDRVAAWAFRTELRKLDALDEYVSGLIRG